MDLLGAQVLQEVVTCVCKGAEVGIGTGAKTEHCIPERGREGGREGREGELID